MRHGTYREALRQAAEVSSGSQERHSRCPGKEISAFVQAKNT